MSLQLPVPVVSRLNEGQDGLKIWSCTNCRRRKVRCDRRQPCVPCTRNNAECVFPISGRNPRRNRQSQPNNNMMPSPMAHKHESLLGRLRSLEAMVSGLSSQVETAVFKNNDRLGQFEHSHDPDRLSADGTELIEILDTREEFNSSAMDTDTSPGTSDSLHLDDNGEIIVGDRFWTVFCNEVEQVFESVRKPGRYEWENHASSITSSSTERKHLSYFNFLQRQASATKEYDLLFPPPAQMLFLFQAFVDYIDPFVKVLHVPSMTKIIRELRGKYHSRGPGIEALVSAIALAAVSVLDEEDVSINLGHKKAELIERYRRATEVALEKAGIMTTTEITVLQALLIYTTVLSNAGERDAVWGLTGLITRIAVRLDLHKDGTHFSDLSRLEIEVRRRVWWQICITDSRAGVGNSSEFLISETAFDTQLPSNLEDAELTNKSTIIANILDRRTNVIVFLIRCEMWRLARHLPKLIIDQRQTSIADALGLLQDTEKKIQEKYLHHLDPHEPLDMFVKTMVMLSFIKMTMALESRDQIDVLGPELEAQHREHNFWRSVTVLDYMYKLQYEASWSPWRWHISDSGGIPYGQLRIVIGQLCACEGGAISEKAWEVVAKYIQAVPETSSEGKSLRNLAEKARERYEEPVLREPKIRLAPPTQPYAGRETGFNGMAVEGDRAIPMADHGKIDANYDQEPEGEVAGNDFDLDGFISWQGWDVESMSGPAEGNWEFGDIFNL